MAWLGVVDIAGFRGVRGEHIVKELGVCTFMAYTLDYAAYTSCVFAPPYEPPPHHLCTFGDGALHGIAWECGVIHLSQLGPILNRAVEDVARLYCKCA